MSEPRLAKLTAVGCEFIVDKFSLKETSSLTRSLRCIIACDST